MAEPATLAAPAAELPPRSPHPGELYRFGVVWWQQAVLAVFFGVFFLMMFSLGIVFVTSGKSAQLPIGVFALVMAFGFLYPAWRAAKSRVVITEQGIKVRNHVRNYDLTWDEIEAYQYTGYDYLRLTNGKRIRLYGLSAPMWGSKRVRSEGECVKAEVERHHPAPAPTARA